MSGATFCGSPTFTIKEGQVDALSAAYKDNIVEYMTKQEGLVAYLSIGNKEKMTARSITLWTSEEANKKATGDNPAWAEKRDTIKEFMAGPPQFHAGKVLLAQKIGDISKATYAAGPEFKVDAAKREEFLATYKDGIIASLKDKAGCVAYLITANDECVRTLGVWESKEALDKATGDDNTAFKEAQGKVKALLAGPPSFFSGEVAAGAKWD
eukprot:TRINITY_DN102950_c0_g1_i1.p2 TRINITY_DN102950_c0_g1~~TRINITY_DN102950_c0_g1_i1.p2  ORF type:complete len:211 (+),score=48.00 TRINITY_DN102950_c0_g1_i1:96-728(+)